MSRLATMQFTQPAAPTYRDEATIAQINADPGFGQYFTDHMATARWTAETGWGEDAIVDYSSVAMHPAGAVFHYAQEVFEGLKAYRHADGSVWLFRPEANATRFQNSAFRLALPKLPIEDFLTSVQQLVRCDARWVPDAEEHSLYIRPFMVADEDFLGVRAAQSVRYCVITSPVGAYFKGGVAPVDIWVARGYSRVANGGTGAAKCGGNYAASLLPQNEAYEQGCSQVLFTDACEHRRIEELGGMNFFLVTASGELVTPELNGNILPGITRDSVLKVAPKLGLTPVERPVYLDEVYAGIDNGSVTEVFACGTAAVINPIGSLRDADGVHTLDPAASKHTLDLRNYLVDVQYGRRADEFGWMQRVC